MLWLAGAARAQTSNSLPEFTDLRPINGPAVWLSEPTREQIQSLHPERAAERRQTGSVDLLCRVRGQDGLLGCVIANEDPTGWGFGAAALHVSDLYRIASIVGGQPTRWRKLTLHVDFTDLPPPRPMPCIDCGLPGVLHIYAHHWWWPFHKP